MEQIQLIVEQPHNGIRIDKYMAEQLPVFSRSFLQKILKDGQVFVNEKSVKANYKICENDEIIFMVPENQEPDIVAEDLDVEVLYEDKDVILVNKPKGMVVHPSAGHFSGTLVNFLMHHCKDDLSGINGVLRPGIVHRIDMDTTGVLIVCKNDASHQAIAEQLKEHSINRRYRAIVHGVVPNDEGRIETLIGRHPTDRKKMSTQCKNGKEAITNYKVLQRFANHTYIECKLETGRTHQIRVHMASIGHPLLGDETYGNVKTKYHLQGQCLHAMILGFVHPTTKKYIELEAPLPEYFQKLLKILP